MTPKALQILVAIIEQFFNATRTPDSYERVQHESWLVKWFQQHANSNACAIFQRNAVFCYLADKIVHSFPLPAATARQTIWCNGKKISALDDTAFAKGGKLLMLGGASLILTMPKGTLDEKADNMEKPNKTERQCNNNNNNNNNG